MVSPAGVTGMRGALLKAATHDPKVTGASDAPIFEKHIRSRISSRSSMDLSMDLS